jgi:hypothetical protein
MKTYGDWKYSSTIFDLITRYRWVAASHPCRFIPGERAPGTHWIGGWLGPRVGLDAEKRKKIIAPTGNRIINIIIIVRARSISEYWQ